jgi:hypothetical protein
MGKLVFKDVEESAYYFDLFEIRYTKLNRIIPLHKIDMNSRDVKGMTKFNLTLHMKGGEELSFVLESWDVQAVMKQLGMSDKLLNTENGAALTRFLSECK